MRHLDLFSGIGGFTLAGQRVWGKQHEIVAFCEIDPFCQKVLRKNFPDTYIHDDIKTLTSHAGAADLITAGFPCQPYSQAGQRKGAADDRALWHEALRIINETRPTWVVAENVVGIVSMELDRVCTSLEDSGYAVETFNIPACAVNAPHKRERIWIVAHSDRAANGRAETSRNGNVPRHISTAIQVRIDSNPDREWQQQSQGAFRKVERRALNSSALSAPDTSCEELQGHDYQECPGGQPQADARWRNAGEWNEVAARFCRMDDGLSPWIYRHRQQRLKALGNAIVPQVVEEIFRAIQNIETSFNTF
jgi:DNA (cytosine-5)-methyltransferase 1